jgi:hypothetical protein
MSIYVRRRPLASTREDRADGKAQCAPRTKRDWLFSRATSVHEWSLIFEGNWTHLASKNVVTHELIMHLANRIGRTLCESFAAVFAEVSSAS